MKQESITFDSVRNDGNGNPRYVCHFLKLNTRAELDANPWVDVGVKYELALKRARTIGGRKFHNKQFGGGIVFVCYSLPELVEHINRVTGRQFTLGE